MFFAAASSCRVRVRVSVVAEMEEVTEGVNNLAITEPHKKNRIQVSNTKKPLFFYVNLAKVRFFPRSRFFFLFFSLIVWGIIIASY